MNAATRVLVADDNDTDRLLLSSIVRKQGYDVEVAIDGLDALRKFASFRPQMVLLDALMPGMDGFEVAEHIKAQAGDELIPVIFLTSLTGADELARCVQAGGDDFLSKPFNTLILKAKLEAFGRMRQLHATMQKQRDEIAGHHAHLLQEQQAAKAVFDNVAHTGSLDAPFIKHLISPLAVFNGDVLLSTRNPAGDLYVLLGDFTGHGLTAAIGAMPLAEIFYGMARKGFGVGEILSEANRKLKYILPQGYFCCATLVGINFHKGTVEFWNGGLPPGVLIRDGDNRLTHLESAHLPLGIFDEDSFDASTRVLEVAPGDMLLMCTDGVIEARNESGEQFGFVRFDQIIETTPSGSSAFDRLQRAVDEHMGMSGRDDDITLVEVTMVDEAAAAIAPVSEDADILYATEEWKLSYELGPRSLRSSNPLPLLQHVVMEIPQLRQHAGEIHTVLAELYSNALEHGLMKLDSSLKSTAAGFSRYYQDRAKALGNIKGFVRFQFTCRIEGRVGELIIKVVDSGPGFDYESQIAKESADDRYHGRGIRLLSELCDSLRYRGKGNEVEVVFSWGGDGQPC